MLPKEHKAWFQERGFPADDIDNFCIEVPADDIDNFCIEVPAVEALHGGDWKLARKVPQGQATRSQ